eukprot:15478110-Alexandrium_andersonii.AAC.1
MKATEVCPKHARSVPAEKPSTPHLFTAHRNATSRGPRNEHSHMLHCTPPVLLMLVAGIAVVLILQQHM